MRPVRQGQKAADETSLDKVRHTRQRHIPNLRACLSAFVLVTAGSGCGGRSAIASAPLPPVRVGFPVYDGTVSVDPPSQSLRAHWRIAFVRNGTTGDSAAFLLNDALTISGIRGRDVVNYTEQTRSGLKRVTVRFAEPATPGGLTEIEFAYSGAPRFSGDSINDIRPDWVELNLDSFWFPVFDGFAQSITARLRLHLPAGWNVTWSGSVARTASALVLTSEIPLIDVAFAASPLLQQAERARVSVYHLGTEMPIVANVLDATASCARYLTVRYGSRRPLPHVKVVLAPRRGPGYARKNYVVITRDAASTPVPLNRFVCHELAHYWSSGAVPSGPENWLNEGFAEFVSARYARAKFGDTAYTKIVAQWREQGAGQRAIWTPDATARPSARTAYRKAPYLLHRLEERVGSAVMDQILVRFMITNLRTTSSVIDMIAEVAGPEAAVWVREELGT